MSLRLIGGIVGFCLAATASAPAAIAADVATSDEDLSILAKPYPALVKHLRRSGVAPEENGLTYGACRIVNQPYEGWNNLDTYLILPHASVTGTLVMFEYDDQDDEYVLVLFASMKVTQDGIEVEDGFGGQWTNEFTRRAAVAIQNQKRFAVTASLNEIFRERPGAACVLPPDRYGWGQ